MQLAFLQCDAREALIGGGGRSGKSDAALMRLLRYAHIPGYSGLCLRRTYAQMNKADAIMARAIEWWRGKHGVRWDVGSHTFFFACPGGGESRIAFGHMDSALSFYDYQGSVGHCCIFDELTHFEERQYMYLFSRQSRPTEGPLSQVPLFMGSTANPGGVGHAWVKARFVDEETRSPRAVWIRANVEDNPSVDLASYEASLAELDPVTRSQLRHGSWDDLQPGDFFDQANFVLLDEMPPLPLAKWVRFWDIAGSRTVKAKSDPIASCLMALVYEPGNPTLGIRAGTMAYVADVTEDRWPAGEIPDRMALQAAEDGKHVMVRWEEEPGSNATVATERAIKPALVGFDADGIKSTGSKSDRARPFAARVANRKVFVLKRAWTKKWADQHHRFPAVEHDDMVDATSGAYNHLDSSQHSAPKFTRGTPTMGSALGSIRGPRQSGRDRMFG